MFPVPLDLLSPFLQGVLPAVSRKVKPQTKELADAISDEEVML
jgi:hypothetical protein